MGVRSSYTLVYLLDYEKNLYVVAYGEHETVSCAY